MAINYTTLAASKSTLGSLANWLNRTDLPSDNIILEAEALIYETLRVREMQAREAMTFSAGVQTAALPTGYLDPISFRPYEWGTPLPFVHEDSLDEIRDSTGTLMTGTPTRWTVLNETAYVDVLPTAAFSGMMLFYKRPTALSVSNETNFLTTRYPTLLRQALMCKGYEHMKDSQNAQAYMAMAMGSIAQANATNELSRRNQYIPA